MDWSRRVVVRLLLVSLWTVSLFALVYPARAQAQGGGASVHTVEAGETLSQIARQYGIDVATLLELNDLANANLVYVGQQLVVSGNGSGREQPSRGESRGETRGETRWADDKPIPSDQGYNRQGSSWEAEQSGNGWEAPQSGQPYQRAGRAWEPEQTQRGPSRPNVDWEGQRDDDDTYDERESYYEEEDSSYEEESWDSQRSPHLEDWESVHSEGSSRRPGSSWEPQPSVERGREAELTGEKWIDIDISDQVLTAYVGDTAVRYFTISSGSSRYPTVTGSFRTYSRTELQDMSGGSEAAGDYYFQADVPWVQYFFEGYAIHGAYWHNLFGTPIGHGCINMRVDESQWLYEWTGVTGIRVEVHQ